MAKPQSLLAKKKVKKQGTHVFRRWQHDRFKCVKVRKQGPACRCQSVCGVCPRRQRFGLV